MRKKNRTQGARKEQKVQKALQRLPPLSVQAEIAFYQHQQEAPGEEDIDQILFLPFLSFEEPKRVNNRTRGWSGTFSFSFTWAEAPEQIRKDIERSLRQDYGCEITEGEDLGSWDVEVLLTGKRVKRLTAMLNRQYSHGYLVWREW